MQSGDRTEDDELAEEEDAILDARVGNLCENPKPGISLEDLESEIAERQKALKER